MTLMRQKILPRFLVTVLSATLLLCPGVTFGEKNNQEKKKETQQEKKTVTPGAIPKLWRDPGNISEKDLYWGLGSPEGAPKPPFKFVKENLEGSNPKVDVTDANGTKWAVKFEPKNKEVNEVHSEVAASRIVGAFGYVADEMYLVPSGVIEGTSGLKRAKDSIGPDGSFKNARFKKHLKGEKIEFRWNWNKNPFSGTRELSGLKILMIVLGNWDTKTVNNAVLETPGENRQTEAWYYVADLGTAFGKVGKWPRKRTMWILEDYQKERLIEKIERDIVHFHYTGRSSISKIPLEHVRWFAGLLSQLSQDQVRKALEASGATPQQVEAFSAKFMEKIRELQSAVGQRQSINCGFRIAD
jgi:hypothetical protein